MKVLAKSEEIATGKSACSLDLNSERDGWRFRGPLEDGRHSPALQIPERQNLSVFHRPSNY